QLHPPRQGASQEGVREADRRVQHPGGRGRGNRRPAPFPMKDSERSRDSRSMSAQKDIMSVCLAVVRGRITPDQARAAILARTSPAPLIEMLHLDPGLVRDAEQLARLPERDREQCLELFEELYDSTPGDQVLEQ